MEFYVPTIGDRVYLAEPWTFDLYAEYRNSKFIQASGYEYRYGRGTPVVGQVTLPANTKLCIDRVYIRGKGDDNRRFDSITFYVDETSDERFANKKQGGKFSGRPRFWVKLRDANKIVCDVVPVADEDAAAKFRNNCMTRFLMEE